jgi:hypothetical protein
MPLKGWTNVNTWGVKGPLLLAAALLGFFDHSLHWGRALFAAMIAMVLAIIGFRDLWSSWKFWVTVALLTSFQIPLVIALRARMDKAGLPWLYAFTILDLFLIVATIYFVCSRSDDERHRGTRES